VFQLTDTDLLSRAVTELVTTRVTPYLRASKDRYGNSKSVKDQSVDFDGSLAAHPTWAQAGMFKDNNRSASRFATRDREAFVLLVAAIEAGQVDIVWLWEFSRQQRRLKVFAELRDLCRERGVQWYIHTAGRVFDLNNSADRIYLGFAALMAEEEAELLSDRSRRSVRSNLRTGRPHGRAPWGYRRVYDERTRALLRQEADPQTAKYVREIKRRVAAGDSYDLIAKDLTGRVLTPNGGETWAATEVRRISLNPVYIGKRAYTRGKQKDEQGKPLTGLHDGMWKPLIDEETHWACVRRSEMPPTRQWTKASKAKYLLTGIALCGSCQGRIGPAKRPMPNDPDRLVYYCRDAGCVAIEMTMLDAYVLVLLEDQLSRPQVWEYLASRASSAEAQMARDEAAKLRESLAGYKRLAKAGKVSPESFAEIEPGLLAGITAAERRAVEMSVPASLRMLAGLDPIGTFKMLDLTVRRQIVRDCIQIWIMSVGKGNIVDAPDRVAHVWLIDLEQ
jgi:site-specific DNA recombinase